MAFLTACALPVYEKAEVDRSGWSRSIKIPGTNRGLTVKADGPIDYVECVFDNLPERPEGYKPGESDLKPAFLLAMKVSSLCENEYAKYSDEILESEDFTEKYNQEDLGRVKQIAPRSSAVAVSTLKLLNLAWKAQDDMLK